MMIQPRAFLLASVICVTCLLAAITSKASGKIERLAKDFQNARAAVVDKEIKQRKILSGLFIINKKLKKIVSEKAGLEQQRLMLESSTNELTEKIAGLDGKVKEQKSFLRKRISTIYKLGGQGVARFLVASRSSAELERNLKILGLVAKKDLDLINDYSDSVRELEIKKNKLTRRLAKLKGVEQKIRNSESSLVAETELKNRVLTNLRKSHANELDRIAKLREQTQKLNIQDDGLLDLLSGPAFFEQKGKLPVPVNGKLRQEFGIIRDVDNGVALSHKGLFLSSKRGSPISAVFPGKVAFLGEIPSFGKTLILDHGDHYYTVYANAEEVYVTPGQIVKQQEKIAAVGNASVQFGEGMYFEIRHFSEPFDPRPWMKGTLL